MLLVHVVKSKLICIACYFIYYFIFILIRHTCSLHCVLPSLNEKLRFHWSWSRNKRQYRAIAGITMHKKANYCLSQQKITFNLAVRKSTSMYNLSRTNGYETKREKISFVYLLVLSLSSQGKSLYKDWPRSKVNVAIARFFTITLL